MAIPIRFAIDLLHRVGWKSIEDIEKEKQQLNQIAGNAESNSNTNTQPKP
jgi:hypothetical protein